MGQVVHPKERGMIRKRGPALGFRAAIQNNKMEGARPVSGSNEKRWSCRVFAIEPIHRPFLLCHRFSHIIATNGRYQRISALLRAREDANHVSYDDMRWSASNQLGYQDSIKEYALRRRMIFPRLTLSLVVLTSAVAQLTIAANPTKAPVAVDVALRDGGVLVGRVVNADGVGQPGAPVSIRYEDKVLASAKAGPEGYFAFKGLHGGVYQLTTTDGHGVYRVWSLGSAPPAAQPVAALIEGDYVVRGQAESGTGGNHPVMTFLQSPAGVVVVAGAVAAAVSLPVALIVKPRSTPQSSSPASP